ncbi:hypothetical protein E6H29_00275 [Candidatus Bathyarchaeota archaeon]|nr:MAG: hypothetical protein E6H29_00275 [Candidatus Bathyarchaeota archaeon]
MFCILVPLANLTLTRLFRNHWIEAAIISTAAVIIVETVLLIIILQSPPPPRPQPQAIPPL